MTYHFNLIAPVASVAMPTFSVGPVKYARNARRTGRSRTPMRDTQLAAINGDVSYCQHHRQSAASLARDWFVETLKP